eukprot:6490705-Amphidinium_carterae.1
MSKLADVLSIVGSEIDMDLDVKVQASITQARVTKASGCLLAAFLKSDAEAVRQDVRLEVKELRTHEGNKAEEKLLHPIIWSKVASCLKGN